MGTPYISQVNLNDSPASGDLSLASPTAATPSQPLIPAISGTSAPLSLTSVSPDLALISKDQKGVAVDKSNPPVRRKVELKDVPPEEEEESSSEEEPQEQASVTAKTSNTNKAASLATNPAPITKKSVVMTEDAENAVGSIGNGTTENNKPPAKGLSKLRNSVGSMLSSVLEASKASIAQSANRISRKSSSSFGRNSNIFAYFLGWWTPFYHNLKERAFLFRASKVGLIWFPLAVMMMSGAAVIAIYNVVAHTQLPAIAWYNAMHILILLVTELVVLIFSWGLREMNRFRVAWSLAFNNIKMQSVLDAVTGKRDSTARLIFYVTLLFQINGFITMFFAEWEAIHSNLGMLPCIHPDYDWDSLKHFTFKPDYTQGEMAFASAYMYGLPLADGMVAGLGPIPKAAPAEHFEILAHGPLLVIRVDCDAEPSAYVGTPPVTSGNGLVNQGAHRNRRSFNLNLKVVLPSNGFPPNTFSFNSTWVEQEYVVDEWGVVTAGQIMSTTIGAYVLERHHTGHLYAGQFINELESLYSRGLEHGYDYSTDDSEGNVLVDTLEKAAIAAVNSTWFSATHGTSSNFMNWGTMPDGYYYANLTARGLTTGFGSTFHQVFLNYKADEELCEYFAQTGAGAVQLMGVLVTISNALLGLAMFMVAFQAIMLHVLHPVKNKEAMQLAATCVLDEPTRLYYLATYITNLSKQYRDGKGAVEMLLATPVRLGEPKANVDKTDEVKVLVIAPVNEVFKMRAHRSYLTK